MPKRTIHGIELNYETKGEGQPLVFIHGLGSSGQDWEYQVDFFCNHYQVLTYDVRGHGASEKPPGPYSMDGFAGDAATLLQELGMAPAHVVGISMGGMISLQLALDAAEVVKSLVVVNATPDMVVRNFKQRVQLWQRFLLVRLFGMRSVGEVLAKRIFPDPDQSELRALFVERWAKNDPRAWQESLKALVGWSVMDRLSQILCPVLVISADQDYTPVAEKAAFVKDLPNGKLVVIENSHHATPIDQPERFNQVLLDFIGQVDVDT